VLLALARCMGGATAGLAGHGRAPSWCTACLLDPWRAASPLDSASDVADGAPLANASLLWMLTAGVRSCRRSKFVVPVGHAPPVLHRLFSGPVPAIQRIYAGRASTVSPPYIGWQAASCLHATSATRGSGTSRRTISSGGRCLLPTLAQLVPQMVGYGALSGSLSQATGRMPRAARRPRLELCRVQLQLSLVWLRAAAVGVGSGDVADVGAN
jgi:hypothetical protein